MIKNENDVLSQFFDQDEDKYFEIHSLKTLGDIEIIMPFIIKANDYGLDKNSIRKLCTCLELLILRNKLIKTNENIELRLNEIFQNFTEKSNDITPIIDKINWMKETNELWWAHWNNKYLKEALNGKIEPSMAIYLLWKYENYLLGNYKKDYSFKRFDEIVQPELEYIAPKVNAGEEAVGYGKYDNEFINKYIDCLGNYLLLSKSHAFAVGNKPFSEKRDCCRHFLQQQEIKEMTKDKVIWDKDLIKKRQEKIIQFILKYF